MKIVLLIAFLALVVGAIASATTLAWGAASGDRDWSADHARPARIAVGPTEVHIADLRDFEHRADGDFTERYRDETVKLDDVRGVWFALAPFAQRWRGLAHTFVSFELEGDRFISVSVEARRERDETYSVVRGMLGQFEMTYVVGTEHDLIGLRALRGDTLFLYPSRATPEQARALFVDMLGAAEAARVDPVLYHTLARNCATVLRAHVNRILAEPLPFGWAVLFPGYSDTLALERRLLDTDLPIDAARERFRVDERARAALAGGREGVEFSRFIREPTAKAKTP